MYCILIPPTTGLALVFFFVSHSRMAERIKSYSVHEDRLTSYLTGCYGCQERSSVTCIMFERIVQDGREVTAVQR